MKWLDRFLFVVRRPRINWLSYRDVYEIHDRLRGLFYKEPILIAPPKSARGIYWIMVKTSPAAGPSFAYSVGGKTHRVWLNCLPWRNVPVFHYQPGEEAEIEVLPLWDNRCSMILDVLRGLSDYCPLYPSEDDVVYLDGPNGV